MEPTHVNVLLRLLIESYFARSRCVLILTDGANQINIKTEHPLVYFRDAMEADQIFQNFGCRDIILGHDDPSGFFQQFETLLNSTNERFNTRRYVIFSRSDGKKLKRVFATHQAFFNSNILVIVKDKNAASVVRRRVVKETDEIYSLFTNSYRVVKKFEFLDKWFSGNASFLHGTNLFPDKLYDQRGKNLTVGGFTFVPYSVLERDKDNNTIIVDGTEMNVTVEFAKKHNMTMNYAYVVQYNWGVVYDNWTGGGLFKGIMEDTTDVVFGALYTWEALWNYTDFSKTLSRAGVNCLVPAPQRASGLATPLLSFSSEMWIGVLITFLCNVVMIAIILQYESTSEDASVVRGEYVKTFDKSLMTLIRIYLLQSFDQIKGGKLMVYVLSVILLHVVLVSTSYGGGLASVMVLPRYEHPIETLWDLKDAGIEWGSPDEDYLLILKNVKEEPYQSLLKKSVLKPAEELRRLSFKGIFGYIIERLQYGYFTIPGYIQRDVISNYRSMREDVYYSYCHLMLKKHSVLIPLMNRLIFQLFESGIPGYWESQGALLYSDMVVQRTVIYNRLHPREREIVKLRWRHVEGAFSVLLAGWVAACLALLCERSVKKFDIVNVKACCTKLLQKLRSVHHSNN